MSKDATVIALQEIEAEVQTCTKCPLYIGTAHGVPGEGNYHSLVLFIGEGPGAEEDRLGKPFIGRSGKFLTDTLANVGIARADVFITNVVKHRPPGNRDPEPNEIAACSDYLERQIALINPRIIITLGRISMSRWFPNGAITKIHGKPKNIGYGRIALPMFHPAAALRNPAWRDEFEKDFVQLPGLIERAKRANEAVARGEALPAGAPHPGDPGYEAQDSKSAPEASAASNDKQQADQLGLFG